LIKESVGRGQILKFKDLTPLLSPRRRAFADSRNRGLR
jgi:hypothetical protein